MNDAHYKPTAAGRATTAKKPTTAEILTATGTTRNVGNTSNRRGLNSSREGSGDSVRRRGSRDEATSVGTHQQQVWQQHKRQLEHLGMPTTEGMLTTVGAQQQGATAETPEMWTAKELQKQKGWGQ
jgi:hypothetical protein